MPIELPPISRRRLLSSAAAAAALAIFPGSNVRATSTRPVDPNRFALLADTHINAIKGFIHRTNIRMYDQLLQVSDQIIALDPHPAAVLINGDCAHLIGTPGDYERLVEALRPLREAGLTVHLALGNHDHRENFRAAFDEIQAPAPQVEDRHAQLLQTPHVNWFILDSLEQTNMTPGSVGQAQREWLAQTLDEHADRPALVMVHHQPDHREGTFVTGLIDTAPLLKVLRERPNAKAWIFGHRHRWSHSQRDGLHLINLPTTAYVFDEKQPAGWVDARSTARGITFELRALNRDHPQHGQKIRLSW
jgi:3',5'-cyclic-AMP phosphodiesterase